MIIKAQVYIIQKHIFGERNRLEALRSDIYLSGDVQTLERRPTCNPPDGDKSLSDTYLGIISLLFCIPYVFAGTGRDETICVGSPRHATGSPATIQNPNDK